MDFLSDWPPSYWVNLLTIVTSILTIIVSGLAICTFISWKKNILFERKLEFFENFYKDFMQVFAILEPFYSIQCIQNLKTYELIGESEIESLTPHTLQTKMKETNQNNSIVGKEALLSRILSYEIPLRYYFKLDSSEIFNCLLLYWVYACGLNYIDEDFISKLIRNYRSGDKAFIEPRKIKAGKYLPELKNEIENIFKRLLS